MNGLTIRGPGRVSIGDNFHCGTDCTIFTETHNYHGQALPYDDTYTIEPVQIGKNVWLGDRVTILPGVSIGDGAIIQVGSVVCTDIEPLAIAGGHPARPFARRNMEHYLDLADDA